MPLILLNALAPCAAEIAGAGCFLLDERRSALQFANEGDELIIKLWGLEQNSEYGAVALPSVCVIRIGKGGATAEGCAVLDWGDFLQVLLKPRVIRIPASAAPKLLGSCAALYKGSQVKAELYRDNGARLALTSQKGALLGYYAVGCEQNGRLSRFESGGRSFTAVRLFGPGGKKQRLILLDENLEEALNVIGDTAEVENGHPVTTERIASFCGYERRTVYELSGGAFVPSETETGFFTHDARTPESCAERALCLVQAIGLGKYGDAEGFLSAELSSALSEGALSDFFGPFGTALLAPDALSQTPALFCGNFYSDTHQEKGFVTEKTGEEETSVVTVGTLSEEETEPLLHGSGAFYGLTAVPKGYQLHMRAGTVEDIVEA